MKMKRKKKQLSLFMAFVMLIGLLPMTAFAENDGICEHHAEHTAECGYIEAVEGSPCGHLHDAICGYYEGSAEVPCDSACVDIDDDGVIDHITTCSYVEAVPASECTHVHDDSCGYTEAVLGVECGYDCAICSANTIEVSNEAEFRAAIATINTNSESKFVISMQDNITLTGNDGVMISSPNTITIAGNGYTLKWGGLDDSTVKHSMINITASGVTLNLGDGETAFTIDGDNRNSKASLIKVASGNVINMYGGTTITNVFRHVSYGAIVNMTGGSFNIYGGTITKNKNTTSGSSSLAYSALLYFAGSSVTIYNGEISYNETENHPVVYVLNNGELVIHDGLFKNNDGHYYGGAFGVNASTLRVYGGVFTENRARQYGAAVYMINRSEGIINGGTFTKNTTSSIDGGTVYVGGSTLVIGEAGQDNDEIVFDSNTPAGGACIFASGSSSVLTINSGTFTNNKATSGAVLSLWNKATANINGGYYSANEASQGIIALYYSSELNIYDGAVFDGNRGSVLNLWLTCTVNMHGGEITNNIGHGGGGGVVSAYGNMNNTAAVFNMYGGTISGNSSEYGGMINATTATINLMGGTITDNTATGGLGGALYLLVCRTTISDDVNIYNNHANSKGDDIYCAFYKKSFENLTSYLKLENTWSDAVLDECGDPVQGWFVDGWLDENSTLRWNAHDTGADYYAVMYEEANPKIDIALKAAHDIFGHIEVTKVVEGSSESKEKEFNFIMTLSNPAINGIYGDMEFVNGVANFTLKDGETKTAMYIPYEDRYIAYTIQEAEDDNFTVKVNGGISLLYEGQIPIYDTEYVVFENVKKGSLSVSKTVTGETGDKAKDFSFTITLTDEIDEPISGTIGGTVFDENGQCFFTLKDGEEKTFTGLPAGTRYEVTESDNLGYAVTVNNTSATTANGVIVSGEAAVAAFNNHKESETVDPNPVKVFISANKTLDGAAPSDNSFLFVLKEKNGNIVQTKNNSKDRVIFDALSFSQSGTYEYTLQEVAGNDSNIIYDDTVYAIKITVSRSEDYIAKVSYTIDGQNYIGTPIFVNITDETPTPPFPGKDTGSITVSKVVTGNAGSQTAEFHFTVTLNDASINGTYGNMTFVDGVAVFTLKHGEQKTASALPAGIRYTVAETEANQDGYTTAVTGATGMVGKDLTKSITFVNHKDITPVTPDEPSNPENPTDPTQPIDSAPQTGDESNIGLWLTLILCSFVAFVGLCIYVIKHRYSGRHVRR